MLRESVAARRARGTLLKIGTASQCCRQSQLASVHLSTETHSHTDRGGEVVRPPDPGQECRERLMQDNLLRSWLLRARMELIKRLYGLWMQVGIGHTELCRLTAK